MTDTTLTAYDVEQLCEHAHHMLDANLGYRQHPRRQDLERPMTWEDWRTLPGKPSCLDGRQL